ncbi:Uncharacterised protein [Shewanella putrefaciens]|nr:Uncharacterised protein [Shewanella putrefaciens]
MAKAENRLIRLSLIHKSPDKFGDFFELALMLLI